MSSTKVTIIALKDVFSLAFSILRFTVHTKQVHFYFVVLLNNNTLRYKKKTFKNLACTFGHSGIYPALQLNKNIYVKSFAFRTNDRVS